MMITIFMNQLDIKITEYGYIIAIWLGVTILVFPTIFMRDIKHLKV